MADSHAGLINSIKACYQRFLAYGGLNLIGMASWMCQECNGIVIWLWNELELCFQFQLFLWKMQVLFLILGAAFLFLSIRFCLYMYAASLGQTKQAHDPCIQCFWICDFHDLFPNLFAMKLLPIMRNLAFLSMHEIFDSLWVKSLHKKIQNLYFSIFLIFNFN